MLSVLVSTAGLLVQYFLFSVAVSHAGFDLRLQDAKLDVPDEAAQKDAERTIRSLFKDEYAKRAAADRIALAKNFLRQGMETKDDSSARYVLLRESQELAARSGDLETAVQAVEEMSRLYRVNPLSLRNAVLSMASAVLQKPEELKNLAQAYLALAEDACQGRQFDLAVKASQSALSAGKKTKDVAFVSKAESQSKVMVAILDRSEKVNKSADLLAANPEDPEASQAIGEFECFLLGDWESGLSKLVKGADPTLRALAARDLSKPSEGVALAALGDAWWDRSEKESDVSRSQLRRRAGYWYEQASAKLSGLSKVKVDRRLEELGSEKSGRGAPESSLARASSNSIDLLALVDLRRDAIRGNWTSTPKGIVSPSNDIAYVQLPYVPGEEYDLTVVAKRGDGGNSLNIGVVVGADSNRHQGMVGFDCGPGGDTSGVGGSNVQGRLLADVRRFYTIVCMVRKGGVHVQLDGKKVFEYQGDPGSLSVGSQWVLPAKDAIFIGSWTTSFTFSKITLTPIAGQGKKLASTAAKELPLVGANVAFDKKLKMLTIDLLATIDPKRDGITGAWSWGKQHDLVGAPPMESMAKCQIANYVPPAEYDLTLVLSRKEGGNGINIGLVSPVGQQFVVSVDVMAGTITRFDTGEGEAEEKKTGRSWPGRFFENGKPRTLTFMIRNDAFVFQADGKDFMSWKGDWKKVPNAAGMVQKNSCLFLVAYSNGVYDLSRITLTAPKE